MKNLSVFLLFSCMNMTCLFAQTPWALFPEKQVTYWQTGNEIKLHYNDSTIVGSDTNKHYFGAVYYYEDVDHPCFDSILALYFDLIKPPVDSLFSTPEYWFATTALGNISFYHKAEPGFSWNIPVMGVPDYDEIIFTCENKMEEMFFGETDSVKTYAIETKLNGLTVQSELSDFHFKLSKNAGFLTYIPFQKLTDMPLEAVYEMAGYIDDELHGFTSRFEDYFGNLQPGQVFKWKEREGGQLNQLYYDTERFYFDSILSVNLTNEKIELTYFRKGVSQNWHYYPDIRPFPDTVFAIETIAYDTFYRSQFDPWTTAVPDWFVMPSYGVLDYTLVSNITIDSVGLKSVWLIDDINTLFDNGGICEFNIADGCTLYRQVTSGLGLTNYRWGCFAGVRSKQLLGYTLDGVPYGDLDPVSPVFEVPAPNVEMDVFPNPATAAIRVNLPALPPGRTVSVKITDTAGRVYTLVNMYTVFSEIDVSSLPAGLYFVTATGDGLFGREKFVKR